MCGKPGSGQIERVLAKHHGNYTHAAKELGLSRQHRYDCPRHDAGIGLAGLHPTRLEHPPAPQGRTGYLKGLLSLVQADAMMVNHITRRWDTA